MKRREPAPSARPSPALDRRPPEVASTVRIEDVADVDAIEAPHVNAVVLERRGLTALTAYARTLAETLPLRLEVLLSSWEADGFAGLAAIEGALPADDARDVILSDIAFWSDVVTDLSDAPHVRVRLICRSTPVFPGFLVDPGTLRLVCTYAGAPTEWLDERDVDRALLGRRGMVPPEVIRRGAVVQRCRALDVLLLKGLGWPMSNGVVYRAPAATEPRLLLSIEPAWEERAPPSPSPRS